MKYQRHLKILELVQSEVIETQEQLLDRLRQAGFDITQATVSRDIKELRLFKKVDRNGNTRYDIEGNTTEHDKGSERYRSILRHNIRNIDYAGNLVVIKCFSGMAQAVCAAIDSMHFDNTVGTIAGDDTIFMAVRTEEAVKTIISDLNKILQ